MGQMVKVKMVGSKMIHHPVAGTRTVWPLDQFTLRRIADKDIEIQMVEENAKEGDEPKRAAPKEQADR